MTNITIDFLHQQSKTYTIYILRSHDSHPTPFPNNQLQKLFDNLIVPCSTRKLHGGTMEEIYANQLNAPKNRVQTESRAVRSLYVPTIKGMASRMNTTSTTESFAVKSTIESVN